MASTLELRHDRSRSSLRLEPTFGCVATSWSVGGEEMLALPVPREEFLASERTGGLPLLYPYANRLRKDRFEACGRTVDLANVTRLKRDGAGLPIHGLLLRWPRWKLHVHADGTHALATIDWASEPELLAAFPYPHSLEVSWTLSGDAQGAHLEIATVVRADRGVAVPVSFGWHPYFRTNDAAHARIELPARRRVALDSRGVPELPILLDALEPASEIGVGGGDDALFAREDHDAQAATIRDGARTLQIRFDEGCAYMQVFSPKNASFISLEPMAAHTSALADGSAPCVAPGSAYTMRFSMHCCSTIAGR